MAAWVTYLTRSLADRIGLRRNPDAYLDKRVIVGVTVLDKDGALIEQFQVHGRIASISDLDGVVIVKPDAGRFTLPPSLQWLRPARPGEYRLRSTGETVIDPDYLMSTTLSDSTEERVHELKSVGFTGPYSQ